MYLAQSHTLHTYTGNVFGSMLLYCRVAEKCKTCFFSHHFIFLSFTKLLNVLKMIDVRSTEQIMAWELCFSVEVALSQVNPAYWPESSFVVSPWALKQDPIPPSSATSPLAAQIRFRRWPQPTGWISCCDYSFPFSSSFFSLAFSVPFGESFRSCSPDPSLVAFSYRQPQQKTRNCRCYSSSSSSE